MLTWDHVPPKNCGNFTATEIQSFQNSLAREDNKPRPQTSPNGHKYRTLCSGCNNELLGAKYDPALGDFVSRLKTIADSSLHLPDQVQIFCDLPAVVKSVLGHLIASKVDTHQTVFDESACSYLLDEASSIPSNFHVYGWVYPYPKTVLLRDCVLQFDGSPTICNFIGFFPFAFFFTDPKIHLDAIYFNDLLAREDPDASSISIPIKNAKPYGWPWHPDFSGVLFGGQGMMDSTISEPRRMSV